MNWFLAIVRRDLTMNFRHGNAVLSALGFFIIAISLYPLSLGPDPVVLQRVAGGVIWVAALFAVMLTLERVFAPDAEDGTLEQFALLPLPLSLVALAKALAHWLSIAVPLILAAPIAALTLNLDAGQFGTLALALLLGTPSLSLIGCLGAALTLGVRQSGVLLILLILPLYVPILIFGAGALEASDAGAALRMLGALSLIALVLAPWATAAALKLAME